MKRIVVLLSVWFVCVAVSFASQESDLVSARRAQALLGTDVWSQVVRIENTGSTAHYSRVVHALVFELVGMLWFYTDAEGTQSFSTYRGRLAQDKADFGPLMREIHSGFTHWTLVQAEAAPAVAGNKPLPNGCFIESVANLRRRLLAGDAVLRPQLLSYYAKSCHAGHTVLTFETDAGVQVIDPAYPSTLLVFPRELARNAQALGTALVGRLVDKAIWISVGDFATSLATHYAGI